MKITGGTIENFRSHGHMELDLDGNIIGIIGPNGSGKSNFLKAIQYAFSGEVPGYNKDQLLKWGAEKGYVEFHFEHNGEKGFIKRGVGTSSARLKIGKTDVKGITKVNETLRDMVGIDKDIARMVFIPQDELDSILFSLPSKREKAFQKLCGIGETDAIYSNIGNFVSRKLDTIVDHEAQLEEARARRKEAENRKAEAEKQLEDMEELSNPVEELSAEKSAIESCTHNADRISRIIAELHTMYADMEKTRKEHEEVAAQELPAEEIKKKEEELSRVTGFVSDYTRVDNARRKLKAAEDEKAELEANAPEETELDAVKHDLDLSLGRDSSLRQQWQQAKDIQNAVLSGESEIEVCPTCGTPLSGRDEILAHLNETIPDLERQIRENDVDASRAAYNDLKKRVDDYKRRMGVLDSKIAAANADLERAKDLPEDMDIDTARNRKMDLENEISLKRDISVKAASLSSASNAKQQQYADKYEEFRRAVEQMRKNTDSDEWTVTVSSPEVEAKKEEYRKLSEQISRRIEQASAHASRRAALSGQAESAAQDMARLDSTISDLEEKQKAFAARDRVVKKLESVRDFFHYNNGPHQMSMLILNKLTERLNGFLRELCAPFTVEAENAELSYRVRFHDGREVPEKGYADAYDLSGGQRTMLAIAFRLSTYIMFANKLGLLSMDEPTADLDEENVGNVCEMMETLRNIASSLDLQMFISTHERRILPFVDLVVDFGK